MPPADPRAGVPAPWGAVLCVAAGLYLVAGFAYVATVYDWPPFWPPMGAATAFIEVLARNEMAAVGFALLFGGLFVLLGPVLLVLGLWRIRAWRTTAGAGSRP